MSIRDLNIVLSVDQSPEEVFNAVNNVRGWWSEALEGDSAQLGDVFSYQHKDIHYSKHELVEVVPNEKIVWLTKDSDLTFLKHRNEWTGTKVSFDISKQEDKTQLQFIHHGLVPESECYGACSMGWGQYVGQSLLSLITTGKGKPDKKDINTTA